MEKPFTEFHKNRSTKSGYSNYCVDCKKLTRKSKSNIKLNNRKFEETYDKWVVYEFYDNNNICIYVGQSKVFAKRFIQHNYDKRITDKIKRIVCYIMDSFPDMAFLEAQKIIEKQPKYNTRISESSLSKFEIPYTYKIEYDFNGQKLK